jgi:alpha-mannosidase
MNRANADRLTQGEALWAMSNPARYPAGDFDEAWRDVLLYSEHTWGADVSISAPESPKTKEQWAIKRAYATHADEQSRALLANVLREAGAADASAAEVDVFNTSSWPRTDLVTLSREQSAKGDRVSDMDGTVVPSQRLLSGELIFLAREVPPFASRRYAVSVGAAGDAKGITIRDNILDNGIVHLEVDPKTGGITNLEAKGIKGNLVEVTGGDQLNEYLFLPGDKLADLEYNGPVTISVKEKGPLVAALVIESEAPGCRKLTREVRLAAGADYVELINNVDKLANREGKESVNFAFPFNVPDGVLKLDVPFGEMRTDTDQIPGACKNWFTVNRWADVANADFGVTWVSMDAPLIEVGGLTARLLNSQTNPDVWRKKVERTQKFYSWVMNNHWGTNYRRYQEGPAIFRYFLRPHKRSSSGDILRFALGLSQPLLAKTAGGRSSGTPLLRVNAADVLVPILKPSDDGKAWIVRLFGASSEEHSVKLEWGERKPKAVFLSDTSETAREKINGPVSVPGFGLVTLRAEF